MTAKKKLVSETSQAVYAVPLWLIFKGIVSRDFGTLFLFHWIDLKVVIGPGKVYFSFY
jgi:hypothetical protein